MGTVLYYEGVWVGIIEATNVASMFYASHTVRVYVILQSIARLAHRPEKKKPQGSYLDKNDTCPPEFSIQRTSSHQCMYALTHTDSSNWYRPARDTSLSCSPHEQLYAAIRRNSIF